MKLRDLVFRPIEMPIDSPRSYVPLVHKNTPERLTSRVTPEALSRNTGSLILVRLYPLLSSGLAVITILKAGELAFPRLAEAESFVRNNNLAG